MKISLH